MSGGAGKQYSNVGSNRVYSGDCKCGARRIDQQIGLEETPEQYVAKLVEVFREVRRVLHPSGTCWINIGDSYANDGKWGGSTGGKHAGALHGDTGIGRGKVTTGLGPKQLLGIPWRLAFALQADGWILRSEIIWHKLAPMPESVTDRCTKAHEQVFLLAKSERYFFDQEAIREPLSGQPRAREFGNKNASARNVNQLTGNMKPGAVYTDDPNGRNKRSVWTLGPEPYSGSHYAVMPSKLVEICLLAGSSAHGCCSKCLAPWERVVEREASTANRVGGNGNWIKQEHLRNGQEPRAGGFYDAKSVTLGWQPTCTCVEAPEKLYWCPDCDIRAEISQLTQGCPKCGETMIPAPYPVIPCTVLDPFFGSGTVGAVALKHGRRFVGIDLDARNIELAQRRIEQSQPMLLEVTP